MGELTYAKELIAEFHAQQHSKEGIHIQALQAQGDPKGGILSQVKLTPTKNTFSNDPRTHPTSTSYFITTSKPSYNQVTPRTHNHWNLSHDPSVTNTSHDLIAHDPGNITHDLPRNWLSTTSQDQTWFGYATHLLINTWKTVGRINRHVSINKIQLIGVIGVVEVNAQRSEGSSWPVRERAVSASTVSGMRHKGIRVSKKGRQANIARM